MKRSCLLLMLLLMLQCSFSQTFTNYIATDLNGMIIDHSGVKWYATNNGAYSLDSITLTNFTKKDGLPSNNVYCVAEDSNGNKWFGSDAGVTKYDGKTWVIYDTKNGLINNSVTCIAFDMLGNKWIGTDNGISKFDDKNFISYTINNGLSSNEIIAITVDNKNNIWLATYNGISKFNGTSWHQFIKPNVKQNISTSIAIDLLGNKWIGTYAGCFKFNDTTWINYNSSNTKNLLNESINSVMPDKNGNIWFATQSGVTKFDGVNWKTFKTDDGLSDNGIKTISIDAKGNKYFGSYSARISKFDDISWSTYNFNKGLISNYIQAIAFDSEGNKWIGTTNGVSKFDGTNWTSFTVADGLKDNDVNGIAFDKNGNAWFSTVAGVCSFNGTNWETYNYNDMIGVLVDNENNVWTGRNGMFKFNETTENYYDETNGLASPHVYSLAKDKHENILVGTESGIAMYDGIKWTLLYTANYPYISQMSHDKQNNIWFTTWNKGLNKYNGSEVEHYNFPAKSVGSDSTGIEWFGIRDGLMNGLMKFTDDNHQAVYYKSDGLLSNNVTILGTNNQGVWISNNGLTLVSTSLSSLIKPDTLRIDNFDDSNLNFDITSTSKWEISSNQSWLTINKPTGSGNANITMNALYNTDQKSRTAKVQIAVPVPGNGVSIQRIVVIQTSEPLSTNNVVSSKTSLYPNPVTDQLNISLGELSTSTTISITSINGIELYSTKINENLININMSKYLPGYYLVKVITSKETIIKKIIKQ